MEKKKVLDSRGHMIGHKRAFVIVREKVIGSLSQFLYCLNIHNKYLDEKLDFFYDRKKRKVATGKLYLTFL